MRPKACIRRTSTPVAGFSLSVGLYAWTGVRRVSWTDFIMAASKMGRKPTQRARFGAFSEGLPGSTLERGMYREKRQELGNPYGS